MNTKQTSRGTHASVLSTGNRQLLGARFLLLLFLALSMTSLQIGASARDAASQPNRQGNSSVTGDQSQPSAYVTDQIPAEGKTSTTSRLAKASALISPACQQALVECLRNGGEGDCFVQYYACIESGQ